MSRPSRSVPSQCAALGGIRRSSMSMSVGLGNGNRSAKAAARTMAAIQPTASQNSRPNFDNRDKTSTVAAPAISALTRMSNPGIEHGVEEIDKEIDDHKARRHEQHHALQDHKVAGVDGPQQQPADARQREHRLHDDGAPDQATDVDAGNGDEGERGWLQGV